LGILDDSVVEIDLVFGVLIARSGRGPVSFQGCPVLQIFHLNLPWYGTGNHLELAALDDLAQAEHLPR